MTNERFNTVWDALSDAPAEAENLRIRSELMQQVIAIIEDRNWEKTEAAKCCGITLARLNELMSGRVAKFSLDALISIAAALKVSVHVKLHPDSTST